MPLRPRLTMLAAVALLGSLLAVDPAAAADGGTDLLGDDAPSHTEGDVGTSSEPVGTSSEPSVVDEVVPDGPTGPVGFVDAPTFEAVRVPGEIIPSDIRLLQPGEDVTLVTHIPEETPAFQAVLMIEGTQASTEYRFEKAVPEGHTAEMLDDGSVLFVDEEGKGAGGIAPPWAIDADGNEVRTSYALDGDALIQTVEHEGAAYPVAADPLWFTGIAIYYGVRVGIAVAVAYNTCSRVHCGPVIGTAVSHIPTSGSGSGSRPSNTCNSRNRAGC